MNLFPLVSAKDIVFVDKDGVRYVRTELGSRSFNTLEFQTFKSLDDLFKYIEKSREIILVLNNDTSFETEVTIASYLEDETLLQSALEAAIEKKPSINQKAVFHYLKDDKEVIDNQQSYRLFGFDKKSYNDTLKKIPDKKLLKTVSSPQYLLFNYCQSFIIRPYIVLYRFEDQDILIASETKNLLFSRSHTIDMKDFTETIRSIEYLLQRFKEYEFTLYLGGDFDDLFKQKAEENFDLEVKSFKATPYPLFLEGLFHLPEIFNFIPKDVSAKRVLERVSHALILTALMIFFISIGIYFNSYSEYKQVSENYNSTKRDYTVQIKSLKLLPLERLEQLLEIEKLYHFENLHFLKDFLLQMKPIFEKMELRKFLWTPQDTKGDFEILLYRAFSSLLEMDDFLLEHEDFFDRLEEKENPISVEKGMDLNKFSVTIKIASSKNSRSAHYKKGGK